MVTAILEKAPGPGAQVLIRDTTEELCRLTGLTRGELIGQPLANLYSPDENRAAIAAMNDTFERGVPVSAELLCRRAKGGTFWLDLHLMPADAHEGGARRFMMEGRDVTAAREETARHLAVEGLLTQVFIVVDAAVSIVNAEGRFLMVNPAYDRLLGYAPGSLPGRKSIEVVAEADFPAIEQARGGQERDGKPFTINIHVLKADGTELPVSLTSTLVRGGGLERFRINTLKPLLGLKDVAGEGVGRSYRVAGKIRMVGLEAVRAALGARWDGLAERVLGTAQQIIERRIGRHDTFSRTDDCGFLICFADLSEDEASLRADALGKEIRERLLGAGEDTETVRIITAAASIPSPGLSSAGLAAAVTSQLDERAQLASASGEIDFSPIVGRKGEPLGRLAGLSGAGGGDETAQDLDLRLIAGLYERAAHAGDGGPIFAEVSFQTFQAKASSEAYVRACHQLDAQVRQRLVLLVAGLEDGVPQSRVLDITQRLRPVCRSVGFSVAGHLGRPLPDGLAKQSFVAVDGRPLEGGGPLVAGKLKKAIEALHAQGARVIVTGLHHQGSVERAFGLGAEFVNTQA